MRLGAIQLGDANGVCETSPAADVTSLVCCDIEFHARLERPLSRPVFLGPAIRGAFGFVLKDTVCQVAHRECHRCLLRSVCPYPSIFEGRPPDQREMMLKASAIPQPFVLKIATPGLWDGDPTDLKWTIRLFGTAARWSPYVVECFSRVGQRGLTRERVKFTIERVTSAGIRVWNHGEDCIRVPASTALPVRSAPTDGRVRWSFLTPVHLRINARAATSVNGLDLLIAGRRRFALLEHFCGAQTSSSEQVEPRMEAADFKVTECALRPWGLSRYSGRQKKRVRLHGLIGEVTIDGPWSRAGRWMRAVEHTHLGKYTTFGFGRVQWTSL